MFIKSYDIIDIGLNNDFIENIECDYHLTDKSDILSFYKFRKKYSHKGDYGHSLIIGGSFGKIGAVVLASKAALTIGSGLVTSYIPKCGYQIIQTALPEVMVEVDAENELQYFNSKVAFTAIGIGVGMGIHSKTEEGFKKFLQGNKLPLVLDADAINLLSFNKGLLKLLPKNSILTPHPKEFERLVGHWKDDYDKLHKLISLSKKYKVIIILKGASTIIAYNGKGYFNSTGNPALATAGSGDVLTGIITGLMAQKYAAIESAKLGVYLHGKTAELGMDDLTYESFTASDCINYISGAYKDLLAKDPNDKKEA
jgi:hydroxyethylthiazole kinase-like uncharacterized protein yjeF